MAVLSLLVLLGDPVVAVERGAVQVVSQPGVEVLWEGVSLGVTNAAGRLLVGEVPPGEFTLTLRKRGFRAAEVDVVVGAGTTDLVLRLDPLPPPPKPQIVEVPKPKPAAEVTRSERSSGETTAAEAGPTVAEAEGADEAVAESTGDSPSEGESGVESRPSETVVGFAETTPPSNPKDGGAGPLVWVFLVALGAVAAVLFLRNRGTRSRQAGAPRVTRIERSNSGGRRAGGTSFLDDLRKRERALERLVDIGPEGGEPEIIDVDVETISEEPTGQ